MNSHEFKEAVLNLTMNKTIRRQEIISFSEIFRRLPFYQKLEATTATMLEQQLRKIINLSVNDQEKIS